MSASTKLSATVKALCFLAQAPDQTGTSVEIARHTGVNASKLRKLLSMMAKSGIVKSALGTRGGFALNRPPRQIHLQEIYCAIEDRKAFHLNVPDETQEQKTHSLKINRYFLNLFAEIQVEIENKMRGITLQSIIEEINKP